MLFIVILIIYSGIINGSKGFYWKIYLKIYIIRYTLPPLVNSAH